MCLSPMYMLVVVYKFAKVYVHTQIRNRTHTLIHAYTDLDMMYPNDKNVQNMMK